MALVTVQRSPSVANSPHDPAEPGASSTDADEPDAPINSQSFNECYYANKGAALVLPVTERGSWRVPTTVMPAPPDAVTPPATQPTSLNAHQADIQHHLQSMFYLLRPEETLKMAVKLESIHPGRTRYLVVVCQGDEAVLLGIDCNERTTIGLVSRVLADTSIKLDGDGGFSVCVCGKQHIFKPVSVQAMWSALQTLHRASECARALNHFAGGTSHGWAAHYERRIASDRSCLNEWHEMDSIESRRPLSPNSLRHKPLERVETERVIRTTLKEIMMSVDLDEVTSKVIRGRLEEELDMDLGEYKSFIDQEMLTILAQMDAPTEIFDHVFLGSEWNASNLEELQRNGVRHILNVTREIDNFFPGMFDYLNVRVYDDEKTDLLKHWDNTFKYITKARNEGSKVLVHCKMGISRSASVVIAYAMKAYNWNFDKALKHVKTKRSCIKPNSNFLNQLETYQGILDAMKNKEKLQRSKSETNLKCPPNKSEANAATERAVRMHTAAGAASIGRPRSWSPDTQLASQLLPLTSVSLESLAPETRHMLTRCANGSYSVSPNQILRLKGEGIPSVRHIVNELESVAAGEKRSLDRRSLRLNLSSENEEESHFQSNLVKLDIKVVKGSQRRRHNTDTWDPGEKKSSPADESRKSDSDIAKCDSGIAVSDVKLRLAEERSPARGLSCASPDSAIAHDLSRHSSWSSHDTRPDDETAKEEQRPADLGVIRERFEPEDVRRSRVDCGPSARLSSSAPGSEGMPLADRPLRPHSSHGDLRLTERATRPHGSHGDLRRAPEPRRSGHVRNLKLEFEARSQEPRNPVRRPVQLRRSFCVSFGGGERPPVAPADLAAVLAVRAGHKRQHGRTHPLSRLAARCSNPVYNTM